MLVVRIVLVAFFLNWPAGSWLIAADDRSEPLQVEQRPGQLVITQSKRPVATYVYRDEEILRPYFANVHVPSGQPITRHHPPRPGTDAVDHETMHPGIWLAFGDISGHDFWRNKGRVEHVEFVQQPESKHDGEDRVVTFATKHRYVAGDKVICQELAQHSIRATASGHLFTFDSQFSDEQAFAFGDQEEMGLGIRIATPLVVKGGAGAITNSSGAVNEKQVWGKPADWCDYSGPLSTAAPLRAGLLLVPHSQNFRRSWLHARDYGALVANPFGQRAFTKGTASRVEVKPGEKLRLRYGVWAYSVNEATNVKLSDLAKQYEQLANKVTP